MQSRLLFLARRCTMFRRKHKIYSAHILRLLLEFSHRQRVNKYKISNSVLHLYRRTGQFATITFNLYKLMVCSSRKLTSSLFEKKKSNSQKKGKYLIIKLADKRSEKREMFK